jgi:D-alanyl-D-alanine carboxypeptidase
MERLLDELAGRKEVHGAVVGVTSAGRGLRWMGARGEAAPGGPPVTPSTPFNIASITKLYVSAAVMRMVEEGELALHERLVDHLPSSITRRLHARGGVDHTSRITIEHLLAQATGLPDYIEDYPPRSRGLADRRNLVEILVQDGDRAWTLEDTARRIREALRPHFPPQNLEGRRVRIRYSDTNFQLLIGIMEARRGMSFAETLEALVLEPLDLRGTWVPGHTREGLPAQPVAALRFGDAVIALPRFLSSIADLNATADDLLRFLRGLTTGELFRSPDTWPRMQARWNRFPLPLDRAALRQPGWPIEYSLGIMRFRLPRFLTPFRPLPAVIGHTGSTGTWLFHVPELDLLLAGTVNQITAGAVPFRFVPNVLRMAIDTLGA